MNKSKWWSLLSLLFALTLLAAACAEDEGDGEAGGAEDPTAVCDEDEFGCVEIAEGDPILLGTLLVISGENQSLGTDSQHGVELAADYYGPEEFDGEFAEIAGHPIE